jgi:adenylate cyclase
MRGEQPGVLGELGLTALGAWQRLAERQDRGRGKVEVAIMFTDLVDFSSWALEAGDRAAIRLLREFGEAIEPPIEAQHGEVVKRLGDGLMAAFWSAPSAAEAAFAAAERTDAIEVQGYRPVLRTGIHLGRPRRIGNDYFGVDVNIAARLADAAKPGEVLVSDPCLRALDPAGFAARRRRFRAKGAPSDLEAHAISPT